MQVSVRDPGIQVLIQKNVGRTVMSEGIPVSSRFAGQERTIDLTPHLGEHGSVTTSKSVRDPAGTFSITLSDKINLAGGDSIYGLIEPMDVVEIRMSANAYQSTQKLPIMMRGFISNVRRSLSIDAAGHPKREVIITGQDYGKIWQIYQVFSMPNAPQGENAITEFPFFSRFGMAFKAMAAGNFVAELFDKIINPYLARLGSYAGSEFESNTVLKGDTSPILTLNKDIQVTGSTVQPFGVSSWNSGNLYALLTEYGDVGPWNELFIEDREDGPCVVYRPNPFMTARGDKYIQPLVKEPSFTKIDLTDIVSMTLGRSDENVANYFWTDAPRYTINYSDTLRAMSYQSDKQSFYLDNYGNCDPTVYGWRKMWEATQQGGPNETDSGNGTQAGSQRDANLADATTWINTRRKQLIEQNKDNVVFETGQMRLKGNESIKAGTYLRLVHGNMESDYYVVSAQHDYVPFGSYTTSVQVERGTGFIDRAKQEATQGGPYYSELVQ